MDHNLTTKLWYVYSYELDTNVQIKIGSLEGVLPKLDVTTITKEPSLQHCVYFADESTPKSIFVLCQVVSDGHKIGSPTSTSYKSFSTRLKWNEWLTLPIKYSELSRDAAVAITLYDYHDNTEPHVLGGTTTSLFSKRSIFRQGLYDLKVWPFQEADMQQPCKTPGKLKSMDPDSQMARLAKLSKRHRDGLMHKVDWLDRLTFREIELINEQEKREANTLFLMVEFPRVHHRGIDHMIIYYERSGDDLYVFQTHPTLVRQPDPEVSTDRNDKIVENLVEAKHHILARSARTSSATKNLKPNAPTRDRLNNIIAYPPTTQLSNEEKDLVWKFRYYLSSNKKALVKFLKTVHWDQGHEVKQVQELLDCWEPMDVEDALELLSPQFFHPVPRKYAVTRLKSAPRDELLLYLLQLVQALKYEDYREVLSSSDDYLIASRCCTPTRESFCPEEPVAASTASGEEITCSIQQPEPSGKLLLSKDVGAAELSDSSVTAQACSDAGSASDATDLSSFLISTAFQEPVFANYLYWYLKVECDSTGGPDLPIKDEAQARDFEMYNAVLRRLSFVLAKGNPETRKLRATLLEQQNFVERLVKIMTAVAKETGNRKRKIDYLQAQLTDHETSGSFKFSSIDGLPLPLNPELRISSVIADKATLFNSALMPCKLSFLTTESKVYTTIFKHGDDLRQDQLILQIITLMDKLLRKDNLDLKLTPYKVLATSVDHGFLQFIESQPLRDVIADWNGSIMNFFRSVAPSQTGPYGISDEVVDNYVKSCAGYSVICYLLGVGDRHLHNLLLCKDGRLFHVDFGFILGRDPKPMPPPMKLTKEMIDGMGGPQSSQWREFCNLCYTAFLHLRRHANLIMNLFSLMVNASIPDIALEPDKTVKKIQERFRLDLDDESAVQFMQQLINESVNAKMATVVDFVHDMAQYWRR